jgi:hypothetical protein
VAVPVLVVAFHWQAARPGWAFNGSDLRYFFFGVREAVAEALRRGDLPWWQRGMFLGYPLVADPQAAVFSPATWLTLPWDAPRALTLATLLHLSIAGWGMAAWMRVRGLSPASGLLAAVAFALGAKQTVHLIHWNFAASTAWWPWMLAGLEGFASRGRGRWLLLAAAASALSWLGGSPQMAYFGSLVGGLWALRLAPRLWRRRPADALLALAAVPAGLLLAGPAVLPAMELSRLGPRGAEVTYAFANSWRWRDAWGLALLVMPRAWRWEWGLNAWEATGYLGILPMALAAAAPLRRGGVVLLAALAVVGLWLPLGDGAPLGLHRLLYDWLPGYGAFRVPTRSLVVTSFAAAALAAEGLEALRRSPTAWRAGRVLAMLAAAAALAVALPFAAGFPFGRLRWAETVWVTVVLSAVGAGWVLALRATRRAAIAAAAAAAIGGALPVGLAAADSWYLFSRFNPAGPAAGEHAPLGEFRALVPEAPAPRRVAVLAKWGATANAALRQGWEGVTGYSPMCVQRVRELLEATRDGEVRPSRPVTGDTNFPRPRPDVPLWRLLAAPLLLADGPQPLPPLAVGGREWEDPLVAYRAEALPRVFWTGAWEVVPDEGITAHLVAAAAGDRAALATAPPAWLAAGPPGGPVAGEDVRLGARSLEATVVAPRPGLAVVLDPFYPGWTATLDGAPAPILRANFAFQAVPVPAGRHALRLEYRNPWVGTGAAASAGTLAALLVALAWRRRARDGLPPRGGA